MYQWENDMEQLSCMDCGYDWEGQYGDKCPVCGSYDIYSDQGFQLPQDAAILPLDKSPDLGV
jgi:predicted ATP-dependent serine protease